MSSFLPSYIRMHRKRLQLSQREVAFLLGLSSQTIISQHEFLQRVPQAKALLKYEALFDAHMGDLFPKLRADAEDELVVRVQSLMNELDANQDLPSARKLKLLEELVRRLDIRGL